MTGCGADSSGGEAEAAASAPQPPPPTGPRLFVTNEMSGDLSVIDVATLTEMARIPLGKRPRGVRASPDGSRLYVALSGSPIAPPGVDERTLPKADRAADGIGVVDVRSLRLLRVIASGTDPEQVAVSADGRWLFVANEDASRTSVVDAEAGRVVHTIAVGGEPEGVDLAPDGRHVYVTAEADGEVYVIDTATHEVVARINVGSRPRATAFLRNGALAFVTTENDGAVTVVDTARHRVVDTIAIPGPLVRPMGIVVAPDERYVFRDHGTWSPAGRGRNQHSRGAGNRRSRGAPLGRGDRPRRRHGLHRERPLQ
jgi:YVTN family beta-propeller protein